MATVSGQIRAMRQRFEMDRPAGNCPSHWGDAVHERDGECDEFGYKPQDGRELLSEFSHGLSKSDAGIVAWDDVSNASLDGSLVVEARKLEM